MFGGAFPIKRAERPTLFFSWGFFLISLLAITLLVSSFTFFLDKTIGRWQFPMAFISALGLNFLFFNLRKKMNTLVGAILYVGVPMLLVAFSLLIANYFYDVSYDGQAYHQEAIIQLKEGWNPYRQQLPDDVNQAIWVNHYAKGMETIQACIYSTFDDIELGKSINIMLWIASICIVLGLLQAFQSVGSKTALLLSFLLASSTVVFNQLITFYVDGALSSCLLVLISLGVFIFLEEKLRSYHLLLIVFLVALMFNIKFTGIFYAGYFLAGLCVLLAFFKRWTELRSLMVISVAGAFVGLLIGYNPYITNMIGFDHPLYPLMGPDPADIMEINTPGWFMDKSEIECFFISLFAHTENRYPWFQDPIPLKIPFSIDKTDIVNASRVDTRLAGFGPFFSGILLVSLVFGGMLVATRQMGRLAVCGVLFLLALIILSLIIVPESWWARYVPQFWFVPFIFLIAAEALFTRRYRPLRWFLYGACALNFSFNLLGIVINVTLTEQIKHQLKVFKAAEQPIIVEWRDSESNRIRFLDRGIPYVENDNLESKGILEKMLYISMGQMHSFLTLDLPRDTEYKSRFG